MSQWLTSENYGDGSDGALTISSNTTEAPVDASCSGTSGTTSLSATNASFASNQIIMIAQIRGTGAGAWELNVISSYTAGTITTKYNLANTYTDSGASQAQVRVMKQYSSATIDNTKIYTSKDWDQDVGGIIGFMCNGIVTITGTIEADGDTGIATSGGGTQTSNAGPGFMGGGSNNFARGGYGEGNTNVGDYDGAAASNAATAGSGGGAGGGSSRETPGAGGGGGHAAAGTAGEATAGAAGGTSGTADLISMTFGGAGGGGGGGFTDPTSSAPGGCGGGIISIFGKTIIVTGSISSAGGAGNEAAQTDGGSGGGGAGGSIILKGDNITLGTGLITAAAGAGTTTGKDGGAGSVGRIAVYYGSTITGTTTPTYDETQDSDLISSTGGSFLYNMI